MDLVLSAKCRAWKLGMGGGRAGEGVYSYFRILQGGFLLKAIVFTVCKHEYINIHSPILVSSYDIGEMNFFYWPKWEKNKYFFYCAEWLYYYLKNKQKLDVSSEGPSGEYLDVSSEGPLG
jgi:hypothetical protein